MASGFIILNDGRCWSRRWTVYDFLLELVIRELNVSEEPREFSEWLQGNIPGSQDVEMGWAFIRADTGENIVRSLDLRELTPANQQMFWTALQSAIRKMILAGDDRYEGMIFQMKRMLRMRRLAAVGDHPDNLSDLRKGLVMEPTGKRVGPGW
jgi:hypothetical protein